MYGNDGRSRSEALFPSVQLVRFGEALARPKIDCGPSMLRHAALWIAFLAGGTLGAASSVFAPGRSFALSAVLALLFVFPALLLDRQAAGKPEARQSVV